MPLHDWTRVEAGIFHAFHVGWIPEICKALNGGLLPEGYYALAEQHAGRTIPDILTLHASRPAFEPLSRPLPPPPATGGTLVAEAPPRTRTKRTVDPAAVALRRSLGIRHVSNHRLVALLEIVSPANKDRIQHVEDFASKAVEALRDGVHLLLIDLFPPGRYDPDGMHGAILQRLEESDEPYEVPANEPATLASYSAGPKIEIYVDHVAIGKTLPESALFLRPDRYINVPLESTYQSAYSGMPGFWKAVIEGSSTEKFER